MKQRFIDFTTNRDRKILIDLNDIRAIEEGTKESEGYCKLYFYSSTEIQQWIKEDYDNVIQRLLAIDTYETKQRTTTENYSI
jgi:hypothetical protein